MLRLNGDSGIFTLVMLSQLTNEEILRLMGVSPVSGVQLSLFNLPSQAPRRYEVVPILPDLDFYGVADRARSDTEGLHVGSTGTRQFCEETAAALNLQVSLDAQLSTF